ncbi:MAG: hypothetical protein WBY53_17275 [Acidobacteriaceae bacterium]
MTVQFRIILLTLFILAGIRSWAQGHSPSPRSTNAFPFLVLNGTCTEDSNVAEGPLDTDLSQRKSRFFCDEAVIIYLDNAKSHVIIDFAEKEAHHSPVLGFAGYLNKDSVMQVENVYIYSKDATEASDGVCKLFYKNQRLDSIGCASNVDEMGRRTIVEVIFKGSTSTP